jgi:hypothetical protein
VVAAAEGINHFGRAVAQGGENDAPPFGIECETIDASLDIG